MPDPTATQRRPNGRPNADPTALTVAEAAARLGISTEAVRMRLKRRTLPGARGEDGTWRVYLPADPPPPNGDPTATQWATERPTERDPTPDPTALVAHLEAEVAYLRAELAERSRELAAERERADVLMREALARIPALGTGEATTGRASTPSAAPGAAEAAEPAEAAPTWLRRLWRLLGGR